MHGSRKRRPGSKRSRADGPVAAARPGQDPPVEGQPRAARPGVEHRGLHDAVGAPGASAGPVDGAAAARVDDEWRRWIAENLMLDLTPESLLATMIARGFSPQEATDEIDLAQQRRSHVGPPAAAARPGQDPPVEGQPRAARPGVEHRGLHDAVGAPGASAGPVDGAAAARVDDEWRRWIAENLMLEGTRDGILRAMCARGIPPEEAAHEIDLASQSPYVRGSERLRNRLKQRDWLLTTYRKLHRTHPKSGEIERRHRLSREEFLQAYYSTNRAVIITGMMDDWPALGKWTLDYLSGRFGDREVEVQTGREADDNYEAERVKHVTRMKFADFVAMVRAAGVTNDFYLTANNNSRNKEALPELWDDIVQVPEYLDTRDRLAGLLWLGPAGTITPFHHDLTNNFMAQVVGRKRVKIAPSWDIPLMGLHHHVYTRIDGRVTPPAPHPGLEGPQVLECILCPGEILFLPVGCMHFVEAIDVSMTITFRKSFLDNDFCSYYANSQSVY